MKHKAPSVKALLESRLVETKEQAELVFDPQSGCYPRVGYAADKATRDGIARLLREIRLTKNRGDN